MATRAVAVLAASKGLPSVAMPWFGGTSLHGELMVQALLDPPKSGAGGRRGSVMGGALVAPAFQAPPVIVLVTRSPGGVDLARAAARTLRNPLTEQPSSPPVREADVASFREAPPEPGNPPVEPPEVTPPAPAKTAWVKLPSEGVRSPSPHRQASPGSAPASPSTGPPRRSTSAVTRLRWRAPSTSSPSGARQRRSSSATPSPGSSSARSRPPRSSAPSPSPRAPRSASSSTSTPPPPSFPGSTSASPGAFSSSSASRWSAA